MKACCCYLSVPPFVALFKITISIHLFASHGTHYFTFSQNIPLSLWGFPGFGWGDPHQGNARPAGGGQERVLRGLPDTDQVDLCSVLQDGVHRAGHVCEGHTAG